MSRSSTSPLKGPDGAGAPAHPIGFPAFNQPAYAPYKPAARLLANEIPRLTKDGLDVGSSIPAPPLASSLKPTRETPNSRWICPGAMIGVAVVSSDT